MSPFDGAHTTSYSTLIDINTKNCVNGDGSVTEKFVKKVILPLECHRDAE